MSQVYYAKIQNKKANVNFKKFKLVFVVNVNLRLAVVVRTRDLSSWSTVWIVPSLVGYY